LRSGERDVPYIQIYFEGHLSGELALGGKPVTIGRGSDCDIRIDNAAISSFHAIVSPELGAFAIEDAASTNGLMVNGKRTHRHTLEFGDEIELPKHTLRFVEHASGVELPAPGAVDPYQGQSATFEVDTSELGDLVAERQRQGAPVLSIRSKRGATEQPLTKIHTTIGKGRGCDIRAGGWRAPRLAATISRRPDGFHLVPEAGAEVKVNGAGISAPHRLDRGDTIDVFNLTLRFGAADAA
jgi:pSer/pThr/pTyr-binding forkhead associated (FHA) protein